MDRVRKVPLAPNPGLKVIARGTPGFLGAERRSMVMTREENRSGG
jgi:ATP-dependent Zn protease